MKIVIDIDEEVYKDAMNGISNGLCRYSNEAIRNGTPLPEGHGDLIDRDALKDELRWATDCVSCWREIDTATTVIPADNSEAD